MIKKEQIKVQKKIKTRNTQQSDFIYFFIYIYLLFFQFVWNSFLTICCCTLVFFVLKIKTKKIKRQKIKLRKKMNKMKRLGGRERTGEKRR